MNEFLQLAQAHHLYLVPVGLVIYWLVTRWGAKSSRPPKDWPKGRATPRPSATTAKIDGKAVPLEARSAELEERRKALSHEIAALSDAAALSTRGDGRRGVRKKGE